MTSSSFPIIFRSLESLSEPIRVFGAPPSARALVLLRLFRESGRSVIVLCAGEDRVAELSADIETLGESLYGQKPRVLTLPSWDQSPYSSIAPSIRTRLERTSTLANLAQPDSAPALIVTTLAASCQATLSPATLAQFSIHLKAEDSVESREALIRRLLDAGYLRVDPVEDPGTFAVRGDIVDVFPPGFAQPIRIELFGDLIERMRSFDPATQRAAGEEIAPIQETVIAPARETLINPQTLARTREQVKTRADDTGIPRAQRDPILSSLQDGIYPDHSDAWAPLIYENASTAWEYFQSTWNLAWDDELTCQQEFDRFLEEQKSREPEAAVAGVIVPSVADLFRWSSDLDKKVRERSKLYLDRVELADLGSMGKEEFPQEEGEATISAKHRVFVKANSDLARGSRHSLGELEPKFGLWKKQGFSVGIVCATQSQLERIRFLLEERAITCVPGLPPTPSAVSLLIGSLSSGFRWPAEGLVLLTDDEILGSKHARKQRRRSAESGSAARDWSGLQALSDLSPGDAVVHMDHGIGRYQGLVRLDLSGAPSDFLQLEYANKDKLYLPVYRLNVIQKYVATGEGVVLDRLGSQQFQKTKEKIRGELKRLAVDLVKLYAERSIRPGVQFSPRDAEFREFESQFPFEETPDQLKAIDDSLADLESGKVMDRLICGDVGYGKTEVAIRVAFRAVSDGKQVAVLVPTTVLAHQHEQSFRARLKDYPFRIESVSRFKAAKEQKKTLEQVAEGKVDIIIGTHRLLSRDVRFRDLGLIIVDEEHRFGVEHKEKLKVLKVNTHVMTLTATPIPRTLHMALAGLRDISLINTPPMDRLPIRTYVSKWDESIIQRAIETELARGGQVFLVHNRVQSIYEIGNRVKELVPQALVGVAHGQMGEGELEEAMIAFYEKRTNVLVCTAIIESGLDVPTANTIIVSRADSFGLAQLYQIRGRVGRGQSRAYAYLMLPAEGAISEDAKRRLEVIQKFVELGSGFSIASHDLEIRGGGDLLGAQQSGHIAAVGFDLYTELLEEAIQELRGTPETDSRREPEIKAPFPAFLAETYVPDVHQRLSLYRRFSAATQDQDLDGLEVELRDRYGPLPPEAQNLLWLIRIKGLLMKVGIDALTVGPEKVSMVPGPGSRLDPVRAIALISGAPSKYSLTPDSKFVARIPTGNLRDLFFALESLFKDLLPRVA